MSNIDKYRAAVDELVVLGERLGHTMKLSRLVAELERRGTMPKQLKSSKVMLKKQPDFDESYQRWYSESKALIRQLLPDRLSDFVGHYEKPKGRKAISYENYTIQDYLQGLTVTRGYEKELVVGPDAGLHQFEQQLAILKAARARFSSSLFDIRQLASGRPIRLRTGGGSRAIWQRLRACGGCGGGGRPRTPSASGVPGPVDSHPKEGSDHQRPQRCTEKRRRR